MVRGKVLASDGSPLIGVRVSVVTQPLYGFTLTRELGLYVTHARMLAPRLFVSSCLVSSITLPFIRIRFRNRFRYPCPHCRSVAPLPFPCRVRITDRTDTEKNRSYLNVIFYVSYGMLTDKRNSYVFLKRIAEIRLWMNGNVTLETRHHS